MSGHRKTIDVRSCCICLEAKSVGYVKVNSELSQLFEYCIGVAVSVSSNNAPVFCEECAEILQKYAQFKKRCLASHNLWENMLCEVKCHEEIKPEIEMKEEFVEEYLSDNFDNEDLFTIDNALETKDDIDANGKLPTNFTHIKNETTKKNKKRKLQREKKPTKIIEKKKKAIKVKENSVYKEFNTEFREKEFLRKFFETERRRGRNSDIKKRFFCIKCGKKYVSKQLLPKHVKVCYGLDNLSIIDSKLTKKPSPLFYCGLCEFSSQRLPIVKKHLNEKCLTEPSCRLCGFVGKDVAHLVSHRYTHHPSEFKHSCYCPLCDKTFWVSLKAEFHYRTEHLQKKGGLCPNCDRVVGKYVTYRNHIRLHDHPGYTCDLCGLRFLFRNSIKEHLENHYDLKSFICDACGRRFRKTYNLKCHILACHTPSTPVVCTHCSRTFKNQTKLDKHISKVKLGKDFICDVCSKGYSTAKELKNHMIWHTDERPFACTSCDNKYKVKAQLTIHMRSHTGFMPFQCGLCEMAFPSKPQLKRHQSVHTGIRRVKCIHCDRTFHTKALMFDHCKSKHGILVKPEKSAGLRSEPTHRVHPECNFSH